MICLVTRGGDLFKTECSDHTYPDTFLDFHSSFTDTEFAKKYCSVVLAPSYNCKNLFNQLTVARREAQMITNSLCERGVATASKHDDVADHSVLVDLRGGIELVENQWGLESFENSRYGNGSFCRRIGD